MTTRIRGVGLALAGAALWGLSGTVSSLLFRGYDMPFTTLVSLRMLIAGIIALAIVRPAFPGKSRGYFLIFATAGLFGVQITYLATIDYSNAPTATLLQYLFFPMVMGYEVLRGRIRGGYAIIASIILAMLGTFELSTGFPGHAASIILRPLALLFGILSAITAALYTLLSAPLIRENGTSPVIAWAFLIGGVLSIPFSFSQSMAFFPHMSEGSLPVVFALVLFVAIVGTLVAFGLYIMSMHEISPTQASLAGTMEPITAAISSAAILGIYLSGYQYLGGFLIVMAIVVAQAFSAGNMK